MDMKEHEFWVVSPLGGARLLTSRRRFALACQVWIARTLAPPKKQIDPLPYFDLVGRRPASAPDKNFAARRVDYFGNNQAFR